MRFFPILFIVLLIQPFGDWETDFSRAQQRAREEHKCILLNFSGSDWCGPCIRLRDDFFENSVFKEVADHNLVLLNADFPRLKKNKLSKEQQTKNDQLAEKYNPTGSFPYTLLLDAEGKVIKIWDGLPHLSAQQFTDQVKTNCNASH